MSTIRVAKRQRFTTIDRATVNDERLSFKARGILLWLLDKPDDWRCDSVAIARASADGRDSVRSGLAELEKLGYLVREKVRKADGTFDTVTMVYETPGQTGDGFSGVGETVVGSPGGGIPGALMNTEEPKTETENFLSPAEASDLFERWWKACREACAETGNSPGSKGDALTEWMKLSLAAKQTAYWRMTHHLMAIRSNPGRFVMPHGRKWLHAKRWEDDTPQEPPRKQNSSQAMDRLRTMMEGARS